VSVAAFVRVCALRLSLARLALLALCALSTPAQAKERLELWHAYRGDEKRAIEAVISRFEKQTGIGVDALQVPHDAYPSKLSAAAPRGHGPHVFIDSHERLGDFLQRGVAAPLGAHAVEAELSQKALGALVVDKKRVGLPLAYKCLALYVNTALVQQVPESWEALSGLKQTLPQGVYPLAYETQNVYFHAAVLHAFGGRQLNADESFGFVGPPAVRSIELVKDAVARGAVPEEASGALVSELFRAGRAATVISGSYFASDVGDQIAYRVVPLPKVTTAGSPGGVLSPYLTVEAAALTPKGAQSPTALLLVHYLVGAESAELRARVGKQVVTRRQRPEYSQSSEFLSAFALQAESAVLMPASARMRSTWEPATRALKKALSGAVRPEAALDEAKRRFDDVVRPPPPPASPTPLLIVIGLLCFGGAWHLYSNAKQLGPRFRESLPAYRWVLHAVIGVFVLVVLPIIVGAGASLYAGRLGEMHYAGFANFVAILTARGGPLLTSGSFYLVLLVTLLWTVLNVLLHVVIGFALGLVLSRPALRLKPLYRVLLIIPWAVPSYVTALAWRGMFSKQFGAVSALLEAVGVEPFSWWAKFSTAFAANLSTNVWLGFPFMMVVTLGALTAVPKEVLEAAEVDGASRWQRLTRVTVPMVVPAMLPAVLLGAIWTFNMFNVVFLVSGGEPDGTTDILVSEAYRWAFTRQAQYGYAAAYSVLIFLLLALFSRAMARAGRTKAMA
jgi:arabinogalactan oligomer/maltooligosaccharide transport system permease protein